MFDAIARLFSRAEETRAALDPQIAVAALLVHLASVDGSMSRDERAAIAAGLRARFGLDDAQVEALIREAQRRDAEAVDFYAFTSMLSGLELSERLEIIEMMWRVVFTDAANHELEDNMVWRVAELIGVSPRERTTLRSRIARERENESEETQ